MRPTDESGLTLVELVVSIAILGIIILPLTGALMIGLVATPIASQRTSNSADAQLLSAYFIPDVQSAWGITYLPATSACSESGTGGAPVNTPLEFKATDSSSSANYFVDYFTWQPGGGLAPVLKRVQCEGGVAGAPVSVVGALGSGTPTIAINGTTCVSPVPAACSAPALPATVQMSITDTGTSPRATTYQFQVSGTQRSNSPGVLTASASAGSTSVAVTFTDALCRLASFSTGDWSVAGSIQGAIAVVSDNLPLCTGSPPTNGVRSATLVVSAAPTSGQTLTVGLTGSGSVDVENGAGNPAQPTSQSVGV